MSYFIQILKKVNLVGYEIMGLRGLSSRRLFLLVAKKQLTQTLAAYLSTIIVAIYELHSC